jgi:hypothetical protein
MIGSNRIRRRALSVKRPDPPCSPQRLQLWWSDRALMVWMTRLWPNLLVDWLAGAAGFELLHLRIKTHQDSQAHRIELVLVHLGLQVREPRFLKGLRTDGPDPVESR